MQHITLKEVIQGCREYYKKGYLLAQHSDEHENGYFQAKYRCAIGTVLNEETKQTIFDNDLNEAPLGFLIDSKIISVKEDELSILDLIQEAHDSWYNWYTSNDFERLFLSRLDYYEHNYIERSYLEDHERIIDGVKIVGPEA